MLFVLYCYSASRDLTVLSHFFPTRRSADLTNPTKPKPERKTESTSSRVLRGSVTCGTLAIPRRREAMAMGSTRMNIQRQLSTLKMAPEIVGPKIGRAHV